MKNNRFCRNMEIIVEKCSSGLKIQRYKLSSKNSNHDVKIFLEDVKQDLIELLKEEQQSHEEIKVKLSLECIFTKKDSHEKKQASEKQFSTDLKTFNNEEEVDEMFKKIIKQMPTDENTKLDKILHLLIDVDSTKEVPLVVFVKFKEVTPTSKYEEYVPASFGCSLLEHNKETYFYHEFKSENVFCEFWEILETNVNEKLKEKKPNFVPIMIADFTKYTYWFLIRGIKRGDEVTIQGSVETKVVSLIKKSLHTKLKCLDFSKFLPRTDSDYDSNGHKDIKNNVRDMVHEFEKIKQLCDRDHSRLDLTNYLSLAQFAWDDMLEFRSKNAEKPIPIVEDEEMINFIAKSIRGGLHDTPKRKAKANNIHVENYNDQDQQTFIVSLNLNNAYGWAMSQNLPWDNFRWVDENQYPDVKNLDENDETGYIFEVDLKYPNKLHDAHSDLPFCCVHSTEPDEPRLAVNLYDKKNYVILDQNLKQCLNHGLKLIKIHRVLQFTKKRWLKKYVFHNTTLRNKAQDSLERNFYKMLNIYIYGKLKERCDQYRYTKVITTAEDLREFNPNVRINKDVGLVEEISEGTKSERSIFAMFTVLELSKMRMYQFHYDVMVKKYGKSVKLLHFNVDNLIYEIETEDFYTDLKSDPKLLAEFVPDGDLSGKKPEEVLGKMKDDSDGKIISKFYSTRYSNHFIRFADGPDGTDRSDGSCKIMLIKPVLTAQEKKTLTEQDFDKCIFNDEKIKMEIVKTETKDYKVYIYKNVDPVIFPGDQKRYIEEDKINTLAKGHK
jgi:hypothetical protein